jgi:hypothetical protein
MPLPAYTIDPAFMERTAERLDFDAIWYAEHPACRSLVYPIVDGASLHQHVAGFEVHASCRRAPCRSHLRSLSRN